MGATAAPPLREGGRRGVFATRSPHRPNPIGLSCVRLVGVRGRTIEVAGADLLDGTPVLDVKPYLPYCDAHPESATGWVDDAPNRYDVTWSPAALDRAEFLARAEVHLVEECATALGLSPRPRKGHRVEELRADEAGSMRLRFAWKTWRVDFERDDEARTVRVVDVRSGYSETELASSEDRWGDWALHREFIERYPTAERRTDES